MKFADESRQIVHRQAAPLENGADGERIRRLSHTDSHVFNHLEPLFLSSRCDGYAMEALHGETWCANSRAAITCGRTTTAPKRAVNC